MVPATRRMHNPLLLKQCRRTEIREVVEQEGLVRSRRVGGLAVRAEEWRRVRGGERVRKLVVLISPKKPGAAVD